MTFEEAIDIIEEVDGEIGAIGYIIKKLQETYAPKLQIPKWAADELEENGLIITQFNRIFFLHNNVSFTWPYSDELNEYAKSYEGYRNISAYLNELTRKFVEVVE